jgi:hypothetical protein
VQYGMVTLTGCSMLSIAEENKAIHKRETNMNAKKHRVSKCKCTRHTDEFHVFQPTVKCIQ